MALALSLYRPVSFGLLIETCVVGFLGSVLYELWQKFLPCSKCKNKVEEYEIVE